MVPVSPTCGTEEVLLSPSLISGTGDEYEAIVVMLSCSMKLSSTWKYFKVLEQCQELPKIGDFLQQRLFTGAVGHVSRLMLAH